MKQTKTFGYLIAASFVGLVFTGILYFCTQKFPGKTILTLFIIVVATERIWENFFTSREKDSKKLEGDWSLLIVTLGYIIMMYIALFEFYFIRREINLLISIFGLALFIIALFIRLWGMKTLGKQWGIHVIGKNKLVGISRKLIKNGPYKYVRHPIYAGVFFEELGIPLVLNSYYALLFSIFFCIPAQIIRTYQEEKKLIEIFGNDYIQYKKELWAFLPIRKK